MCHLGRGATRTSQSTALGRQLRKEFGASLVTTRGRHAIPSRSRSVVARRSSGGRVGSSKVIPTVWPADSLWNPIPMPLMETLACLRFRPRPRRRRGVADLIEHLIKDEEIAAGQILVLFRADRAGLFSNPIKEHLELRGIPVADPDVVKRAFDKEHNRWSLELARLMARPRDSLAWASLLVLTPKVGSAFIDFIYQAAATRRSPFADTLLAAFDAGFPGAPTSASRAGSMIQDVCGWLDVHPLPADPPAEGWGHWLVKLIQVQTAWPFDDDLAQIIVQLDEIVEIPTPESCWVIW